MLWLAWMEAWGWGALRKEWLRTWGDADSSFSPGTGPRAQITPERNDQETLRRKGLSPFMPLLGTRPPGEGI